MQEAAALNPGEGLVYHIGRLAGDARCARSGKRIRETAEYFRRRAEDGYGFLTQRLIARSCGVGVYEYIFTKVRRNELATTVAGKDLPSPDRRSPWPFS